MSLSKKKSMPIFKNCLEDTLPRTKIEIDVAHYIKNWSNSLRDEKKIIKKFYLFAIGQLILCKTIQDADEILKSLLIIALSETAGNGAISLQNALKYVRTLIQNSNEIEDIVNKSVDTENEYTSDEDDDKNIPTTNGGNKLDTWASKLKNEVSYIVRIETGDDLNPRFCPKFATRLLSHIKTIPLWSCIRHDAFGYGRVPPSSAPVESEFKTLKNHVLPSPMRLDMAVETINEYYNGKLKIIECAVHTNKVRNLMEEPPAASTCLAEDNHDNSFEIIAANDLNSLQIEEHFSDDINYAQQLTCIDCINTIDTQHSCMLCNADIHLNSLCSVPLEEEDEDSIKRICQTCLYSSRKQDRIIFNEIENWRNLGKPKTRAKPGLYLTKGRSQDVNDIILSTNAKVLPILINGNSPNLGLVKLGNSKISLLNTCAFDSIFQIVLAAVTDSKKIENYIETYKHNNALFKLAIKVANTKIQQSTYKERAEILIKFFNQNRKPNTLQSIDCSCNVIALTNFLFKNSPSFQEAAKCPAGCPLRVKCLPTITILLKDLQQPLNLVLSKYIALTGVQCNETKCNEIRTNEIYDIANLIVIGMDTECAVDESLIPKTFVCPLTNDIYKLLGVINYIGPSVMSRSSKEVGHYTAVTLRNGYWTVYDDMQKNSFPLKTNYPLHPELLFYGKT